MKAFVGRCRSRWGGLARALSRRWHSLVCGCHRREGSQPWQGWVRCIYPLLCLGALAWFLCRVVPKPIRATYPCQRAAFPLASSLVIWLLGMRGGAWLWQAIRTRSRELRPALARAIGVLVFGLAAWWGLGKSGLTGLFGPSSSWTPSDAPNTPVGVAKGIFPGRVAWMRDQAATPWNGSTGRWWDDTTGINQAAVDRMMSRTLRGLTGATSDAEAWDRILRHFNTTRGRGDRGYQSGEKIAIKINCNNTSNYSDTDNHADASPQSVLALLRQLVNKAGVPQGMITVYEAPNTAPSRVIPNRIFDKCRGEFPNVVYADCTGTGGHTLVQWQANAITYSVANGCGRNIPTCVYQATYLINMALLKGHSTAGVTLTAKNHYGTINTREHTFINCDAQPMGAYSPFVDLIGHPDLGGKTLLFMIDGLYGVRSVGDTVGTQYGAWNNLFGGQWSASHFMSLDPVAIDSVGVDFLRSEFGDSLGGGASVNCDNYLHEAAQAGAPPSGTVYRPDGTNRLASLGVHEHWNNATAKQYSRNLGPGGTGIELLTLHDMPGSSVTLTNPTNGTIFAYGSTVPLQANASASFAAVRQVDFYRGAHLLGTSTQAPFEVVWSNAPVGSWSLQAVATDSDGFAITSAIVQVTVQSATNVPPIILTQPSHQAVVAGATARFSVEGSGWPAPTYRWLKDSAPLPGATSATLTLGNVALGQAGAYSVLLSNAAGVVTSAVATLAVFLAPANLTLISTGAFWKYFDKGQDLGTNWRALTYSDTTWSNGFAELGYGDAPGRPERTEVSFGPNTNNKYITTYFRYSFQVTNPGAFLSLQARLLRDDGAVVYLNGTEVIRDNMPSGTVVYATLASSAASDDGATFSPFGVSASLLRQGLNVIAAEIHQNTNTSSDLSFDFELTGQYVTEVPKILAHPASAYARPGDTATFSVQAASLLPMSYLWLFNDAPLPATNPVLMVPTLTTNDAGAYAVRVGNAAGAVTSAPVSLVVVTAPCLEWATGAQGLSLRFRGSGAPCTVLVSSNLTDWFPLTNLPPTSGPAEVPEPAAMSSPYRFYRVRVDF